jgi:hypothetical protein
LDKSLIIITGKRERGKRGVINYSKAQIVPNYFKSNSKSKCQKF